MVIVKNAVSKVILLSVLPSRVENETLCFYRLYGQ